MQLGEHHHMGMEPTASLHSSLQSQNAKKKKKIYPFEGYYTCQGEGEAFQITASMR